MQYSRELSYTLPLLRGEDVRAVQLALIAVRTDPACGGADGVFGPGTRDAVLAFQRQHPELKEDGVVGKLTWDALFTAAAERDAAAPLIQAAATALVADPPPLNAEQVARVKDWLMQNFGPQITQAAANSPFDVDLICAIACKETAPVWLGWTTHLSPADVLARCVFDASGDVENTSRSAFPENTAAFRARFGDELTEDLIAEANATRALHRPEPYPPAKWVYKGYGIFQYDLQHIDADPDFFRQKQWRDFAACLDRLLRELREKLQNANGQLRDAVRRYNGSGTRAQEYAAHVMQMRDWAAEHQVA